MARFTYPYTRKTTADGGFADSTMGIPSLNTSVELAFGYPFGTSCFDTVLNIIFGQQLTAGEQTTLDDTYTAWNPDSSPLPSVTAQSNPHLISVNTVIPAGFSLTVSRYLEVAAGATLEVGADSDLEIT